MARGEWDDLFEELLEDLGAADPANGIADGDDAVEARTALHRFLFLRQAVRLLADTRDTRWIDNRLATAMRKRDLAEAENLIEATGLGPIGWNLVICDDDDGKPGDVVLANLYESLLAADPDGREFRP